MKTKNSILNSKRPWNFYSVLTKESFDIIKKSLKEDFANQDYVSRAWLIERLCQCVAYIELMEKQKKKMTGNSPAFVRAFFEANR